MTGHDFIALYRADFRSFLSLAFSELHPGRSLEANWHIDVMADALRSCGPKTGARLILNAPPRNLKSFCTSVAWPLFLSAHHPGLEITVLAGAQELATVLTEQRDTLLASKRILTVFPNLRRRSAKGYVKFAAGGRLTQGFIPRSQIGRGSDIIVIDDPLTPTQAQDDVRRGEVNSWYASEILPRLNSAGAVVVLAMQRLHLDDLSGHLLKGGELWRHVALSAVARADETWMLANGIRFTRRQGEALYPARADPAALRSLLYKMGAMNFAAQYLQRPMNHPVGTKHRIEAHVEMLVPLPGYEEQTPPQGGFYKVPLESYVDTDYFGKPPFFDMTGFRFATDEESERRGVEQQARLVAEMQADLDRREARGP